MQHRQSKWVTSAVAVEHVQELGVARSSVSGWTADVQASSSEMQ